MENEDDEQLSPKFNTAPSTANNDTAEKLQSHPIRESNDEFEEVKV